MLVQDARQRDGKTDGAVKGDGETDCARQGEEVILVARQGEWGDYIIVHEWLAFYSVLLNINQSGVFTALAWLVPHETAAVSARSVYTIQPCTMSLHAKATHVRCMDV